MLAQYYLGHDVRKIKEDTFVVVNKVYYKKFRNAYTSMIRRCEKPQNDYIQSRYKDRSISVCESWKSDFYNFFLDMYESFCDSIMINGVKNTTLDRIDNNKGYSPDNCRWATWSQQLSNREKFKKTPK